MIKKYFIPLIVVLVLYTINYDIVNADVCFTEGLAVDIITLLDASERDIKLLKSCNELVGDLYMEIKQRDDRIVSLTDEIINANQKIISYKQKYETTKKIAWYTSITSGILIAIQLASLL